MPRFLSFLLLSALVVHARKCPEEAGDSFKEVRKFAGELQRQVRACRPRIAMDHSVRKHGSEYQTPMPDSRHWCQCSDVLGLTVVPFDRDGVSNRRPATDSVPSWTHAVPTRGMP